MNILLRSLTSILCVLLCAPAAWAGPDVPPAQFSDPQRRQKLQAALPRIDALMADGLKGIGTPGLSYAVVIDGDVVLARGLGLADVAAGVAVDEHTRFRIASMTKSFTALAILKLRDAGKLRLDDPVAKYVPELRGWRQATADSAPVTLRQLLAHAGGLPEDNPQGDRQLALTAAQFSAWIQSGPPLASAPGSAFEYSNLGFMILGRVITNVARRPFQTYITEQILRPLGMTETHWSPATVPRGKLAWGHRPLGDAWLPEPMLEDGAGAAMGGLLTTPADLGRFVAAMLAAWPPRDDAEGPPAKRRTLREMQTGLGWPEMWVYSDKPGSPQRAHFMSYGFGLFAHVDCTYGREVEHSGGLPGFGSQMSWLPDHGVGVIVFSNRTYGNSGELASAALRALHDTGALQPRQPAPAPALQQAARAAAELVADWSDERATALAADNLFLDEPLAERRAAIQQLRAGLGRCTAGALTAENALRGEQRLDCERGALSIQLTLSPTQPPRVQQLQVAPPRPRAADDNACNR